MKFPFLIFLIISNFVFALNILSNDDKNQPMNIQSDFASLDESLNTLIYRGNVVIIQGSLKILGDEAIIKKDSSNNQVDIVIVKGSPAKYEQTLPVNTNFINAYANTIEYIEKNNLIKFIGKASIIQNGNKLTGDLVSYNTVQKIIIANGDLKKKGRVNTTIYKN